MHVNTFLWVLVALTMLVLSDARRRYKSNRSKCYGQYKCQTPTVSTYGRKYIDKCIDKETICNGKPNCPNKDDEINCPCPNLTNPKNGYVDTTDGFGIKKVATYVCITGYFLSDMSTRTCLSNSQWSGTAPSCNIKDCGKLTNIPNGSIQQPSTTFQAITTYSCDQGYTLKGNKQRTCQQNGQWFGITPKCEDVNECKTGLANCDPNAACTNTQGSFTCACTAGYSGKGDLCEDIDECTAGLANCDTNADCTNTPGSFTCACNGGYFGNGVMCEDINECTLKTDNCDCNADCFNNFGSFECSCKSGYKGDGLACIDIDECTERIDNCNPNAACTNTPGSFTCACNIGYFGNGVVCEDNNECTSKTENCDFNAACTNTMGSFTCSCNSGFTGDGIECTDINECTTTGLSDCNNNAECINTPGSFTCTCNTGYFGNGVQCKDLCNTIKRCGENAYCIRPTTDIRVCVCLPGYEGNPDTSCADIDECTFIIPCDRGVGAATCDNTPGSFTCTCNPGFTGDGFTCTAESA